MKIIIKGNSIRFRLTKSEVQKLADSGKLEESTSFTGSTFYYAIISDLYISQLKAEYEGNKITLTVPADFTAKWPLNNVIGLEARDNNGDLYLLLEKDFICLDETTEDQSDNYENPHKTC